MQTSTEIDRDGIELDVTIDFVYHPGEPMVRYYKNGDGHPGCEPWCEIEKVTVSTTGEDIADDLSEKEMLKLESICMESIL